MANTCTQCINTMKILCADPKKQIDKYFQEINTAISKVINSGIYINGRNIKELEESFAGYIGTRHSIGVSNGTTALELVLKALDLNNNDEVITVSHTAIPTVAAIKLAGMQPKLIDIDIQTYTMSPEELQKALSSKTKAVIVVHLYGQAANMNEIQRICENNGIYLIEDCSQAHGAMWKGKKVGSFGIAGCFSCYPTKNLGALGDAGLITTNSDTLKNKIIGLREYGWDKNRVSQYSGGNYRLDEIQAAIIREKLKYLDRMNDKRRQIAGIYNEQLMDRCIVPYCSDNSYHVYHLYVIRVKKRDQRIAELTENGIYAGIHYRLPVHMHPAYASLADGKLINTELIANEIISLPMYPELTTDEALYVCKQLKRVLG